MLFNCSDLSLSCKLLCKLLRPSNSALRIAELSKSTAEVFATGCSQVTVLSTAVHDKQKAACYPAGPTAVIDQQFDAEQGKAVPDSPGRTALIFPCRNNYVLFDGRLGHGVLGSSSKKPRMTMLINWWAEKPQVNV